MIQIDPMEIKAGDVYLMYTPLGHTYPKQIHISVCYGKTYYTFYRLCNYISDIKEEFNCYEETVIDYDWYSKLVMDYDVIFFLLDSDEILNSMIDLV